MNRPSPRAALALSLLCAALPLAAQPAEPDDAAVAAAVQASPAFQLAVERLSALEKRERDEDLQLEARSQLLARNLSRYFTRYVVPEDAGEIQRFLGTLQRTTRDAGRLMLGAAAGVAERSGSPVIRPEHLVAVTSGLLPVRVLDDGDRLYFPSLGDQAVLLERWDLEALADTGMAWEVLGGLAETVIAPAVVEGAGRDVDAAAAGILADTLNAYGLLVLRLGGEVARADRARSMATRHLREAVKVLRARADGQSSPLADPHTPQRRGVLELAAPLFVDATAASGIDFVHRSSEWIGRFRRYGPIAPTFSGGGAAAGDVDGDDWPDLVVCGGRGCSLFLNRSGSFEDVTETSGVRIDGEARMPVLADFDNDGDADLFVTYARDPNRILLNDGAGRFTALADTGLETVGDISGPAAAVDVDNDGLLDLYVGNFGNYLAGASAWAAQEATNGMPNRLYRNLGSDSGAPRFEDVTEAAGVADTGWAQALSHVDADRDGDQDLYVANDFGRNQLYLNRGDGTFTAAGAATGSDDRFHGMNVSFTDLNDDQLADILVTNIWFWAATQRAVTETNTLLLSRRSDDGIAYERSEAPYLIDQDAGWAWAAHFLDVENDGDDDLLVTNGFTDYMTFVQYRPHPDDPESLYPINNGREPNLLFRREGDELQPLEGSGLELPEINSRAAVLLDHDRDGDLDVLLTAFHDRARLLRNETADQGAALVVRLVGNPEAGVNLDAIGSQLVLTLDDGRRIWRTVSGGEGYLGMNELPAHFGLGSAAPESLDILWPDGSTRTVADLPARGRLTVTMGVDEIQRSELRPAGRTP